MDSHASTITQSLVATMNVSLEDRRAADIRREQRQERQDLLRERELQERWAADRDERRMYLSQLIGLRSPDPAPGPPPSSSETSIFLTVYNAESLTTENASPPIPLEVSTRETLPR